MSQKRNLLLGIDVGTQSIRAALINSKGQVISLASTSQEMQTPSPGLAEQDPQFWWDSIVKNIKKINDQAQADSTEILSVGVCAHMHGPVPVGFDGELLSHNTQRWCDKRSKDVVERFKNNTDLQKTLRLSGNPPTPNWFGFKIKWIKENQPDLYGKTYKFLVPKDFINFKLTKETVIDHSEASGSFLMDASSDRWSPKLINMLELDIEKLPELHRASEIIGKVTKEAASLTGLKEGTPVVTGGGDMLCTLLSSGMTEPGSVADLTGTGSLLSFFTKEPIFDERLMNLRHVMPGWIPFGIIDNSGGALRWFRDKFCQYEVEKVKTEGREIYELMDELAANEQSGNEGLLFYPYLMGERTLGSSSSRGVFFGFNLRHNKGSAIRAILEGVAFEHKRTLEIVEEAGHEVNFIYHCGGGANSKLWSQIKADIYQKPVYTLENSEGGIVGAAILAGVGIGIYSNEATGAKQFIKIRDEFMPNREHAERYEYLFELYKEVHDLLQKSFDKLAKMP